MIGDIADYLITQRLEPSLDFMISSKQYKWDDSDSLLLRVGEEDFKVCGHISSWRGVSIGAVHWYGKLTAYGVNVINPKDKLTGGLVKNGVYWNSLRIEVTKPASKDMFSNSIFDDTRRLLYRKGEPTGCFDSRKEVAEAVEADFQRIFGEGWELRDDYGTSWEEEKREGT